MNAEDIASLVGSIVLLIALGVVITGMIFPIAEQDDG